MSTPEASTHTLIHVHQSCCMCVVCECLGCVPIVEQTGYRWLRQYTCMSALHCPYTDRRQNPRVTNTVTVVVLCANCLPSLTQWLPCTHGLHAGRAIDEAVQLWLQRAEAAPAVQIDPQHTQAASPLSKTSTTDPTSSSAIVPGPVMYRLAERLSAASQPLYMTLLLPVSQHKSGIEFLVNLRGDLLTLLKEQPAADLGQQGAALRALDQDLR